MTTTTHNCSVRPGWTPLNTGLMIFGFVVFWPLGLGMLAYILWGHRFHDMAQDAREQWQQSPFRDAMGQMNGAGSFNRTGNVAFDDYREQELKKLEEKRLEINRMRDEFDDFLRNLRKAKDQEEFDRFMSSRRPHTDTTTV